MRRSRAPLAIAAVLAMPLFFVGLMAMSLAVEKPSVVHAVKHGRAVAVLHDPSGSNEVKIWLLALLPVLVMLLVGTIAIRLGRAGVVVSAVAAIAVSIALIAPLGTWARDHAGRFPVGVDLIPRSAGSGDIYRRGEWEANAKKAARQIGFDTIGIAGLVLVFVAIGTVRRRRQAEAPPEVADAAPTISA